MKIIIVFLLKKGPYLRIGFKFFAINILALKQITFYIFFAILMPQNGIMSRGVPCLFVLLLYVPSQQLW